MSRLEQGISRYTPAGPRLPARISFFLVSASVIALQLVLMRSLSITRYHHFSYLVIGTALLGFGVSGTFLTFFAGYFRERFAFWSSLFILLFAVSIPICYYAAENLPIDIQFTFFSVRQVLLIIVYNLLFFIPFFFGAVVIGLTLIHYDRHIPSLYGINLLGSGAGGILALLGLYLVPADRLPAIIGAVSCASLLLWLVPVSGGMRRGGRIGVFMFLVPALLVTSHYMYERPDTSVDQYKMIAYLDRLVDQGGARHILRKSSPRGQVDVYSSGNLHRTMFAGLHADVLPPSQMAVLVDGRYAGTVFNIRSAGEAGILDFTPQSLPYRLVDSPRVLLLGDVGGVNIWLAKRFGARAVTVVQGDPILTGIMKNELAAVSGNVYNLAGVEIVEKEPHLYLEQTREKFDIIHIVTAEGMSSGVSGLQSLHEDYLLTVESIAGCVKRLNRGGFISVTRGIQSPPRDNIKIFALFAQALEHAGIRDAGRHLLQARNYLAVNTMISAAPVDGRLLALYLDNVRDLMMDAEYYPGIKSDSLKQLNIVSGPEGMPYSYLHYAARKILSGEGDVFYRDWAYDVRPPTDDRPYFYDFFKWKSLGKFFDTYGPFWLQKLELGYVILVFTFGEVALTAVLLILVPLFFRKTPVSRERGRMVTVLYFLSVGLGFMFLEMVFIQRFTRFMGSPIYAVSVVLTSILAFAGLGSLSQQKRGGDELSGIRVASLVLFCLSIVYLVILDDLLGCFVDSGVEVRFLVTAVSLAPVSFFMGWMFPLGLRMLEKKAGGLVPWAWGVNGFASVSAAPLSVMLSMSYGFGYVMAAAAFLYLVAGIVAVRFSRNKR